MEDIVDSDDFVGSKEAMADGFGIWDRLMRRRTMKRKVRNWSKGCDFEKVSEIGDDVLASAMQFGKRNHPPRAPKGSISMYQLAPRLRRERKSNRSRQREREREREREGEEGEASAKVIGKVASKFDAHLSENQDQLNMEVFIKGVGHRWLNLP